MNIVYLPSGKNPQFNTEKTQYNMSVLPYQKERKLTTLTREDALPPRTTVVA